MKYAITYTYCSSYKTAAFVGISNNRRAPQITVGRSYSHRFIHNLKMIRYIKNIFNKEYGYNNTTKIWQDT